MTLGNFKIFCLIAVNFVLVGLEVKSFHQPVQNLLFSCEMLIITHIQIRDPSKKLEMRSQSNDNTGITNFDHLFKQ